MNTNKTAAGACLFLLLLAFLFPPAIALADEEEELHRVEFSVQVGREAQNDLARAVMAVDRENVDPAQLARDVNRIMAGALQDARKQTEVRVRSGNYRTYPVYDQRATHDQRRIVRWRAEQELILESENAEALHQLLGALQDRLLLRSMGYSVSPEQGRQLDEGLTVEALEAFKARAELIVKQLGAAGYDIVRLHIGGGAQPPMPMMMARTMAMEDAAAVAGEPGTSRVGTGVHAVIRLRY